MIKCILQAFCLLVLAQNLSAQNSPLNTLLLTKQYPALEKAIAKKSVSDKEKDLYRVFILNAYGQAAESNALMKTVRASGIVTAGDSLDFFLHIAACDNDIKLYDYKSAAAESDTLISHFAYYYTADDLDEEQETGIIWQFLSDKKAQTITKQSDTRLPLKKDLAGLWRLPVSMHDTTVNFVFDTGAGLSTISWSYAKKMGVQLIDSAFTEIKSGVTGISNKVQLGMAPKLTIGNIVVENVVFLVFPDEALSFANGAYVIEGILGLPVIKAFESFSITGDELFIPREAPNEKADHNLALDLLKPVIYMQYQKTVLPFTFDSGANSSTFSNNFYRLYQKDIDAKGKKEKKGIAGAGGSVELEVMVMPELSFKTSRKKAVFKNAEISTSALDTDGEIYYGNIGQDLIGQFKKMTINFKGSYIAFE